MVPTAAAAIAAAKAITPSRIANLNPEQERASTHPSDRLQILAPPGSGKTLTLTARLHHLLTCPSLQLPPQSIVLCTFTTKAAQEIKDRVSRLLGSTQGVDADRVVVGTFHSVARRLLGRFGVKNGVVKRGFGIADRDDGMAIVRRIVKNGGYTVDAATARTWISRRKSGKTGPNEGLIGKNSTRKLEEEELLRIYGEYESQLSFENLLDYDDLLLRCVDLLTQHPDCGSFIQAVLVDEFQDTNGVQYEMMKLLAQSSGRVTVVGDPDQSIYGFRAAEVENVDRMRRELDGVEVVRLLRNYRSSAKIVDLAVRVIGHQDEAKVKERSENEQHRNDEQRSSSPAMSANRVILPTHSLGSTPLLRQFRTPSAEAAFVAFEIHRLILLSSGLLDLSDVAVLIRSSSQARLLEIALGREGIPYKLVGGQRFFDKVEVRVLIDYLRVIWEPEYAEGVLRVVNVPPRGVGDSFKGVDVAKVLAVMRELGSERAGGGDGEGPTVTKGTPGLFGTNKKAPASGLKARKRTSERVEVAGLSLSNRAFTGVCEFVDIVTRGREIVAGGGLPADVLEYVIEKIGMEKYLQTLDRENHEEKWNNVCELVRLAHEIGVDGDDGKWHEDKGENGEGLVDDEPPMAKFLSHVALASSVDSTVSFRNAAAAFNKAPKANDDGKGEDAGNHSDPSPSRPGSAITISTLHAAKGLEWPVVFILGAFEGSIPHSRSEDVEEERRLLYVGITRGMGMVYLTWGASGTGHRGWNEDGEDGGGGWAGGEGSRFGGSSSRFLRPLIEERSRQKKAHLRGGKVVGVDSSPPVSFTTTKAPAIDFVFVRTLSRILDRTCPTELAISLARSEHGHRFEDHCAALLSESESDTEDLDSHAASRSNKKRSLSRPASGRIQMTEKDREQRRAQTHELVITSASSMLRETTTMSLLAAGKVNSLNPGLTTMELLELNKPQHGDGISQFSGLSAGCTDTATFRESAANKKRKASPLGSTSDHSARPGQRRIDAFFGPKPKVNTMVFEGSLPLEAQGGADEAVLPTSAASHKEALALSSSSGENRGCPSSRQKVDSPASGLESASVDKSAPRRSLGMRGCRPFGANTTGISPTGATTSAALLSSPKDSGEPKLLSVRSVSGTPTAPLAISSLSSQSTSSDRQQSIKPGHSNRSAASVLSRPFVVQRPRPKPAS